MNNGKSLSEQIGDAKAQWHRNYYELSGNPKPRRSTSIMGGGLIVTCNVVNGFYWSRWLPQAIINRFDRDITSTWMNDWKQKQLHARRYRTRRYYL
jgi:hypothetical protein